MIRNRLIVTKGNTLRFHLNHTVNGEEYELETGERYFMVIASEDEPHDVLLNCLFSTPDFEMILDLEPGSYIFEIGIERIDREVLIPALDERNRPLNQLIILRRLGF